MLPKFTTVNIVYNLNDKNRSFLIYFYACLSTMENVSSPEHVGGGKRGGGREESVVDGGGSRWSSGWLKEPGEERRVENLSSLPPSLFFLILTVGLETI